MNLERVNYLAIDQLFEVKSDQDYVHLAQAHTSSSTVLSVSHVLSKNCENENREQRCGNRAKKKEEIERQNEESIMPHKAKRKIISEHQPKEKKSTMRKTVVIADIKTPEMLFKVAKSKNLLFAKKNLPAGKYCNKSWYQVSEALKNKIRKAFNELKLKEIRSNNNQLINLIPPSVMKKSELQTAQLASTCLEASMILPMEEDNKDNFESCFEDLELQSQNAELYGESRSDNNETALTSQLAYPEGLEQEHFIRNEDTSFAVPDTSSLPLPPTPPAVMNANELYLIVNMQNEDLLPWNRLSKLDKNQYYKALGILKRDYIRKYISYLHSLSSEQLHKHWLEMYSK